MTVNLSVKAEAYVQELMRDGRYESAEQVVARSFSSSERMISKTPNFHRSRRNKSRRSC